MNSLQAIILGLVQGITEFLPISSSAHLVLVPYLVGWSDPGLTFSIVTNAGSLAAAILYFRHDLAHLARHSFGRGAEAADARRLLGMLAVGTIPVVVGGVLLHTWLGTTARLPTVIAAASIGFGLALGWADRRPEGARVLDDLRWRDAWLIGGAQALALVPGTSRSGVTITAALLLGIRRTAAARFSFLLAVPVGAMALLKDVVDASMEAGGLGARMVAEGWPLAIGFTVAAVSAFATIGWLLRWIARQKMTIFVVYRVLLGALILAFAWGLSPG